MIEIVRQRRRDPNYLDSFILDIPDKIAHYVGMHWLLCDLPLQPVVGRKFCSGPLPEGYTVCVLCIVEDMAQ